VTSIFAEQALLPDGWHADVRIAFTGDRITAVETAAGILPGDERHAILLPGMPNLHSHAFQRGMAGLAELRGPSADSFWSWREVMYRFALSMTPDQVEAVAAQLYVEMLEAGFTRVGEFHYLHHDRDGQPYANIAEIAERSAASAGDTGIGLTLLPVFHAHSSLGGPAQAVTAAQRDGDDLVLTTQDDLLAGVLRVTGVRGARLDTRARLPLAASYIGASVLDDRFRVIGRVRGGDQDHLVLETAPADATALIGRDVWVCSVGPGDLLELPAVVTWQR